jgi:cytochrome c-type biogenesis protein
VPATSLGLALSAGMLAALNPCGFALLPAYLALLVNERSLVPGVALVRAFRASVAMTAGFVGVFAVVGLAVLPVAGAIQRYLPWVTLGLGGLLLVAGIWVLAGRELPTVPLHGRPRPVTGTVWSMVLFGISYALASLSCTIAPFLGVVVVALRTGATWVSIALFLAYAFGMGLVVATAALGVALVNGSLVGRLRRLGRHVSRLSGLVLLVSGAYVAYYGWWESRALAGAAGQDRVIVGAGIVQHWLVVVVDRLGALGLVVVLLGLLALASVTFRRRARRRASLPSQRDSSR